MKPSIKVSTAVSLAALVTLSTGCSTMSGQNDDALQAKLAQLQQQQEQLKTRERAISEAEANLASIKGTTAIRGTQIASGAGNSSFPPEPRPGECYTNVWVKPEYRTTSKQVVAQEGGEQVRIIPAKYDTVTEKVVVQEASSRLEVVPASYRWVEEQIMVKPAGKRIVEVPATYETVSERVIDQPAHTVWKKGNVYASNNSVQRIDAASGEVMCLVEVPATYKTLTKRILKSSAGTRVEETPAQFKTVKRKVVDQPASTRAVEIPAKYKTITKTVLINDAREERIAVPEKYKTVTSRELVREGRIEWRSILCEVNATPSRIQDIQRSLKSKGYNPGEIDGQIGPATTRAVRKFQGASKLPQDGLLTLETVRALGVAAK